MNHDIAINQVIRDRNDTLFRVIWVGTETLAWICLSTSSNTPMLISIDHLTEGLDSGLYSFASYPDFKVPPLKNPEAAYARRDHNWDLIRDIVEQEPDVYDKKARAELMRGSSAISGVQPTNLYKLMGKYWRAGKIRDALLPNYSNVGKTRDTYDPSKKKPGKKGVKGAAGKKITHEDVVYFEKAYQDYYINKGMTLLDTYQNMLNEYYSIRNSAGKAESSLPPDQLPSRNQFYYWHSKYKDATTEAKKRKSLKRYNLENRGGTGRTETHLYGPCALSQIDATIADVFLVRQDDRKAIVGRPTVYFLIDAYSHMVTGVHVSLEKPSWEEATLVLLNSLEDKVEFCKRYGLDITAEQWPCQHLPNAIIGDRGEMEGYAVEKIINSLGITIQNTPPYRGDLKGIVESHFKVMNYSYASLPGHVEKDFGGRCTQDYRLDAVLDINQFTNILIRCVLFHNNVHYMDRYSKTFQMRQHGVKPIALELWTFGMRYRSGIHRVLSIEKVRYELLSQGTASITRTGILFNQMYYTCDQAENEKWFDKARTEGREKISISYDPRNMAYIYIRYGNQPEPIECHLVEYLGEIVGLSRAEVDAINKYDSQEAAAYTVTEDIKKGQLNESINQIVNDAKRLSKNAPGKTRTKAQRLADIKSNLEKEKAAQIESATRRSISELHASVAAGTVSEREADESQNEPVSVVDTEDEVERLLREVHEEKQMEIQRALQRDQSTDRNQMEK
jgi:hypothetical protein